MSSPARLAQRKPALYFRNKRSTGSIEEPAMPPHSIQAEHAVLGALFLDDGALGRISDVVAVEDFYGDANRLIFAAITRLIADGRPADSITVADELNANGRLEYVGGVAFLSSLIEETTTANVRHYAQIVHDRAQLPQLAAAVHEIADRAFAPATCDVATLLDDAAEKIEQLRVGANGVTRPGHLNLALLASQPVPERAYRVGRTMATGTVGEWTGHGGAGKTQCALHLAICLAAARQFFGEPVKPSRVVFAGGEDDTQELHRRLAQQAGKLNVPLADLADLLFVYDLTAADPTLLVVADKIVTPTPRYSWLKREIERHQADVVILDNRATLFDGDVNIPGTATRAVALFQELAPKGGNVIVLAHVDKATARAGYGREAYSGTPAWHNRARWRWYLYQPNAEEDAIPGDEAGAVDDDRRILEIQKNNAGPTGARFPLRLLEGVIIPDGISGGIVASIERNNERKALLAAMSEAQACGLNVPAAESGPSTAYDALEALASFPAALRGRAGKKRVHRLLRQLLGEREIELFEFGGSSRHGRKGYRLSGTSS